MPDIQPAKVSVRRSRVHGRGLFAGERIQAGQFIGTYEGIDNPIVTDSNEAYIIWLQNPDGSEEWRLGVTDLRYINHDPHGMNVDTRDYDFYALRDIEKGEEILWHYGDEFDDVINSSET